MILDFHQKGVDCGMCVPCRNLGGKGAWTWKEQRVQDQKGGGRREIKHRAVCDGKMRDPHLHCVEIPMILKALVSKMSSRARCEAGVPSQRGEQYSIRLRMKAFSVDSRSGVRRKDLFRRRIPSQ